MAFLSPCFLIHYYLHSQITIYKSIPMRKILTNFPVHIGYDLIYCEKFQSGFSNLENEDIADGMRAFIFRI